MQRSEDNMHLYQVETPLKTTANADFEGRREKKK